MSNGVVVTAVLPTGVVGAVGRPRGALRAASSPASQRRPGRGLSTAYRVSPSVSPRRIGRCRSRDVCSCRVRPHRRSRRGAAPRRRRRPRPQSLLVLGRLTAPSASRSGVERSSSPPPAPPRAVVLVPVPVPVPVRGAGRVRARPPGRRPCAPRLHDRRPGWPACPGRRWPGTAPTGRPPDRERGAARPPPRGTRSGDCSTLVPVRCPVAAAGLLSCAVSPARSSSSSAAASAGRCTGIRSQPAAAALDPPTAPSPPRSARRASGPGTGAGAAARRPPRARRRAVDGVRGPGRGEARRGRGGGGYDHPAGCGPAPDRPGSAAGGGSAASARAARSAPGSTAAGGGRASGPPGCGVSGGASDAAVSPEVSTTVTAALHASRPATAAPIRASHSRAPPVGRAQQIPDRPLRRAQPATMGRHFTSPRVHRRRPCVNRLSRGVTTIRTRRCGTGGVTRLGGVTAGDER